MSYDPTYLQLWAPPSAEARQPYVQASPGVPERLEDAGRVLSHGLLLGDILGVDTKAAQLAIDTVFRLPDDLPQLYLEDAVVVLHDTFCCVRDALGLALAKPAGEGGRRLAASPSVTSDGDGTLRVRGTRFPLDLLLFRLDELCRMLADATARGLLVVEKPFSEESSEP